MRESDAVAFFSFFCCLFIIGYALGISTVQGVNNGEPPLGLGSIVCAIANCTTGVLMHIETYVNILCAHFCIFYITKYVDFSSGV